MAKAKPAATKKLAWEPQPTQTIAIQCDAYELFYGGAKGGGKTDFLIGDFLGGTVHGTAHSGIIFRKTYSELEEVQKRARQVYPALGASYSKTDRLWAFPGGATLKLRFLERIDDVGRYQGHQYTWMGFDELTEWKDDAPYTEMLSCLRSPHGIPVHVRATGNPGKVGHAWVKARFIDPAPAGEIWVDEKTGLTRCFIPARLEDNPRLMEKDPDYEKRLLALDEAKQRAFRWGDWEVFVGQVFSEFSTRTHFVRPFPLAPSWYRFAACDWGYSKPYSIGWWCVTGDGRLVKYREWYGCDKEKYNTGVREQADDVAKRAWAVSAAEGCNEIVMDPACWSKQGLEGNSIADTFAKRGWTTVKGNNDRIGGMNRLHDLMRAQGYDRRPMILWFDTCLATKRTFPALSYSDVHPEDVDTDGEDHVYDETRYALMYKKTAAVSINDIDDQVEVGYYRDEQSRGDADPLGLEEY